MNFEMADAEGLKTATVITNYDVAIQDSLYTTVPLRCRHCICS